MHKLLWAFAASLFPLSQLSAETDGLDCSPYRVGGTAISEMKVSQFHLRGEITEPRLLPITWPIESRIFRPTVVDGRAVEDPNENGMSFRISLRSGGPLFIADLHSVQLNISISGADKLPIHSRLGRYGGRRTSKPHFEKNADGSTFIASDGYEFSGLALDGGWKGIFYPNARPGYNDGRDVFAKWNSSNEIDAILYCNSPDRYPTPTCELAIKEEPVFAKTRFFRTELGDVQQIESRTREFTKCLLEGS